MGRAMLLKTLIQFSVDEGAVFSLCCLPGGQTMVEVMKLMVTSLKRSQAGTATVHAPNPVAGHHQPMPSPETPGHPQASLTVPFFWVLVNKFLLSPPRVYFPILCKFWQLYSGVNGDILQEDLCLIHTQSPGP